MDRQTNSKRGYVPPRGIRFFEVTREGPDAKRFFMQWRERGGQRRSEGFASAGNREIAARALAAKRAEHGSAVLAFDPAKWRRGLEAEQLACGVDLVDVVKEWLVLRQGTNRAAGLTVAQAVEKYLALRREEKITHGLGRRFTKHLAERFGELFGGEQLADLTPDKIREWLRALTNPDTGEPMAELTKRHHRKDLNTFLKRAVAEGWLLRNPCESVKPPKVDEEDVTVLAIEDAEKLFRVNRDEPVVGRLALEAFGALRHASVQRLGKEHLDFAAKGITMPGALHKSGKRKFRQGHPANLWAWLRHAPAECWEMTEVQYRHAKREAFVRAGLVMPHNVLRHSFASYHLAQHRNPPLTAYLMQHVHTSTTEIYEGVATAADAARYFAILPPPV